MSVLVLTSVGALAATVYKWVDEKGVIHYSDQPHPNAKPVDVQSAQTYQSTRQTASNTAPAGANAQQSASSYQRCEVYRPENDEVFLNTDTVVAKVRLEPQLRGSDQIAFDLDGRPTQKDTSSEVTLKVERGTHTVVAVVLDSAGKAVCTAAAVRFHVRQPSRQAPNAANRPRF